MTTLERHHPITLDSFPIPSYKRGTVIAECSMISDYVVWALGLFLRHNSELYRKGKENKQMQLLLEPYLNP